MKVPDTMAVIGRLAIIFAQIIVAVPILVALWSGAAYFGIELPRPAWRAELDKQACQMARVNKDYYGRKLSREENAHKRLLEEAESLPDDNPQARWTNFRERIASEEELARLHLIVDPAVETWKGCTP